MLEVKTNKEILKIKSTKFWGFTAKEFTAVAAALVAGVVVFVGLPFSELIKAVILVPVIMIIAAFGFFELDGMSAWDFLKAFFSACFEKNLLMESDIKEKGGRVNGDKNRNKKRPGKAS